MERERDVMRVTEILPAQKITSAPAMAAKKNAQPSRKGKKAWRKNVDIADVEEALEGMRAEERVIG